MNMKIKNSFCVLAALLLMTACHTDKEIPYMINADQIPQDVLNSAAKASDPTVMPGDMLMINVASTDPEAVKPFNKTEYVPSASNTGGVNNGENSLFYYLVDNNGYIEFPQLGKLNVGGMTKSATENYIAAQLYPRYLTEKPNVEVRFMNFRVSVLGEVKAPGVVKAANGRLNLLEALAQVGDLSIQGRRDNIMLIRTNAKGQQEIHRINLNDARLLTQPEFNLRQNDIIYVQPNASRARSSWTIPPALTLTVSSIGTIMSIVTFVVTLTK